MIQIFRESVSPRADAIEAEFRQLVLGYERVVVAAREAAKVLGAEHSLPAIKDGENVVSGEDEIDAYLKELEQFVRDWRKFEGDFWLCG